MPKFTLSIDTDNTAFEDDNKQIEIRRILHDAATKIKHGCSEGTLRDINGNTVGKFRGA
jgi:hypothetical protein